MNIRIFCSLAACTVLIWGCGGSKPAVQTRAEPTSVQPSPDTLSMEIFSLARDTVLDAFVENWPRPESASVDIAMPAEDDTPVDRIIYRIQLFTSINFADASAMRDEASNDFGQEVRVDFETPYYKVRVGSFKSAQEADALLQTARQVGYRGAWVVRVRAPAEDD